MSVATKLKAMFLVFIEEGALSTESDNEKILKEEGIYEEYENANSNIAKDNQPQAEAPIVANEEKSGNNYDIVSLRKRLEKRVGGKQPVKTESEGRPRSEDEELQK